MCVQLLQSCPTLCESMNCSPQGSSVPGDSPGKNTRVCCHALLQQIFLTQGLKPSLWHPLKWQVDSLLVLPSATWETQLLCLATYQQNRQEIRPHSSGNTVFLSPKPRNVKFRNCHCSVWGFQSLYRTMIKRHLLFRVGLGWLGVQCKI